MESKIDLVAYCGLYCPKCYRMKVSGAAEKLLFELESAQNRGAKYLEEDPRLKEKMDKLISLKCHIFCRARQGESPCAIKNCCLLKNILGCWECDKIEKCEKINPQFLENCQKIKEMGIDKFIEQYK
ncbi:MAG: DUF3795 domain-containing protein [bacterium]